jgi:hypothetical protein
MDSRHAIERCEALVPTLDPTMRLYLEHVLAEARLMLVVRELVAGIIALDEES